MEVRLGNSIVSAKMTLGLVPEVLDAINMATLINKRLVVVDPMVMELGHIQHVVGSIGVSVDNTVRLQPLANDPCERRRLGVGDNRGVDMFTTFKQTEDRDLPGSASPPFSFAHAAEVTLVDFDLTDRKRCFIGKLGDDHLAQFVVVQRRRVAVHPNQLGRGPGWNARHELYNQGSLYTGRQPTAPTRGNHMT